MVRRRRVRHLLLGTSSGQVERVATVERSRPCVGTGSDTVGRSGRLAFARGGAALCALSAGLAWRVRVWESHISGALCDQQPITTSASVRRRRSPSVSPQLRVSSRPFHKRDGPKLFVIERQEHRSASRQINRADPAEALRSSPDASVSGGSPSRCCLAPMPLVCETASVRTRSGISAGPGFRGAWPRSGRVLQPCDSRASFARCRAWGFPGWVRRAEGSPWRWWVLAAGPLVSRFRRDRVVRDEGPASASGGARCELAWN
jgi:hypothetical protein